MTCPLCGEAALVRHEGGLAPYLACPVCGYARLTTETPWLDRP